MTMCSDDSILTTFLIALIRGNGNLCLMVGYATNMILSKAGPQAKAAFFPPKRYSIVKEQTVF